jgi:hypothetical protein
MLSHQRIVLHRTRLPSAIGRQLLPGLDPWFMAMLANVGTRYCRCPVHARLARRRSGGFWSTSGTHSSGTFYSSGPAHRGPCGGDRGRGR